jgi:hypothetical protein
VTARSPVSCRRELDDGCEEEGREEEGREEEARQEEEGEEVVAGFW